MLAVSVIEHVICYKRPLICQVARQQTLFCYPLPAKGHLLQREGQFLSSGIYSYHSVSFSQLLGNGWKSNLSLSGLDSVFIVL